MIIIIIKSENPVARPAQARGGGTGLGLPTWSGAACLVWGSLKIPFLVWGSLTVPFLVWGFLKVPCLVWGFLKVPCLVWGFLKVPCLVWGVGLLA